MKKAQGMPMNVIIIAAVVLIVLIVLWAIFTGRMGGFTRGLEGATGTDESCSKSCKSTGLYAGGNMRPVPTDESSPCTGTDERELSRSKIEGVNKACCCTATATNTPTPQYSGRWRVSLVDCRNAGGVSRSIGDCNPSLKGTNTVCCSQ